MCIVCVHLVLFFSYTFLLVVNCFFVCAIISDHIRWQQKNDVRQNRRLSHASFHMVIFFIYDKLFQLTYCFSELNPVQVKVDVNWVWLITKDTAQFPLLFKVTILYKLLQKSKHVQINTWLYRLGDWHIGRYWYHWCFLGAQPLQSSLHFKRTEDDLVGGTSEMRNYPYMLCLFELACLSWFLYTYYPGRCNRRPSSGVYFRTQ